MTICVVRHGETDWNKEKRFQGREDVHLNEQGFAQARKTAEWLAQGEWGAVVSSPLTRAKQTAQVIAERLALPCVDIAELLIERDVGAAGGLSQAEREARFPDGCDACMEPWEDLQRRGQAALLACARAYEGKDVIVVSHGFLIAAVLSAFLGAEAAPAALFLKNACVNLFTYGDGKLAVQDYNLSAVEMMGR